MHLFVVPMGHKNLEYLQTAKRHNSQQAPWTLFFTRLNITLSYRPGSKNTKANTLSCIYTEEPKSVESVLSESCFLDAITWGFDQELACTLPFHTHTECPPECTYVPPRLGAKLITWAHTSPATGQPGTRRTFELLKDKYCWQNMMEEINKYFSSCSTCAQVKVPKTLPAGKLLLVLIPHRPWSHVALDLIINLPNSTGNTTILVALDFFF